MRKYFIDTMLKIAAPVLKNLSQGELHRAIPDSFHNDRKNFILLEAFGRTACGIAPWLEVSLPEGDEKNRQNEFREYMKSAVKNATDPDSADYMNWCESGGQPLVDAGFLAHAVVRAPESMFFSLDRKVRERFAECLKKSRVITPANCNWLLFSAMVETALFVMGEEYDIAPVERAVSKFMDWYAGDGTYKDGDYFHWDYYNSYVIHPMLVDILKTFSSVIPRFSQLYNEELHRASRYADLLEKFINHDGTFAVFGRSSVYRFGAFQLLSQAALQGFLPDTLSASQVRCALHSVIKKVCENDFMFDENGFLTPGVYGFQPDMAEEYINTGSLYLCMSVFLVTGLSPCDDFWISEPSDWTAKKIWSGRNCLRDHAVD